MLLRDLFCILEVSILFRLYFEALIKGLNIGYHFEILSKIYLLILFLHLTSIFLILFKRGSIIRDFNFNNFLTNLINVKKYSNKVKNLIFL